MEAPAEVEAEAPAESGRERDEHGRVGRGRGPGGKCGGGPASGRVLADPADAGVPGVGGGSGVVGDDDVP